MMAWLFCIDYVDFLPMISILPAPITTLKWSSYFLLSYRDTSDADGEAKAASSLGEVFLQMGEYDKAMDYHQMDYDISESHEIMEGKVCYKSWFIL